MAFSEQTVMTWVGVTRFLQVIFSTVNTSAFICHFFFFGGEAIGLTLWYESGQFTGKHFSSQCTWCGNRLRHRADRSENSFRGHEMFSLWVSFSYLHRALSTEMLKLIPIRAKYNSEWCPGLKILAPTVCLYSNLTLQSVSKFSKFLFKRKSTQICHHSIIISDLWSPSVFSVVRQFRRRDWLRRLHYLLQNYVNKIPTQSHRRL